MRIIYAIVFLAFPFGMQAQPEVRSPMSATLNVSSVVQNDGIRPSPAIPLISDRFILDSNIVYNYEQSSNSWTPISGTFNSFNEEGLMVFQTQKSYSDSLQSWENLQLNVFAYDKLGRVIQNITKKWDGVIQEWTNQNFTSYSYNGTLEVPEIETTQIWSESSGEWVLNERKVRSFDDQGRVVQTIFQDWNTSLGKWKNNLKQTLYYQLNKLEFSSKMRQKWSGADNQWKNKSLDNYNYNNSGLLKELSSNSWNNQYGNWQQSLSQVYSYDVNGQINGVTSHIPVGGGNNWTPGDSSNINYDNNGNVTQQIQRVWNSSTQSWQIVQKTVYYWSLKTIVNPLTANNSAKCICRNPYSAGDPISCKSLVIGAPYQLELVDLQGRVRYTGQITGGNSFSVPQAFKSGVYLLHLYSRHFNLTQKLYFTGH